MATSVRIDSFENAFPGDSPREDVLRVGVIGYGYWGPNIVRNFHAQEHSRVVAVCDKSQKSLAKVRHAFPDMANTDDVDDLLTSPDIDLIAVVTTVWTQSELAQEA